MGREEHKNIKHEHVTCYKKMKSHLILDSHLSNLSNVTQNLKEISPKD